MSKNDFELCDKINVDSENGYENKGVMEKALQGNTIIKWPTDVVTVIFFESLRGQNAGNAKGEKYVKRMQIKKERKMREVRNQPVDNELNSTELKTSFLHEAYLHTAPT